MASSLCALSCRKPALPIVQRLGKGNANHGANGILRSRDKSRGRKDHGADADDEETAWDEPIPFSELLAQLRPFVEPSPRNTARQRAVINEYRQVLQLALNSECLYFVQEHEAGRRRHVRVVGCPSCHPRAALSEGEVTKEGAVRFWCTACVKIRNGEPRMMMLVDRSTDTVSAIGGPKHTVVRVETTQQSEPPLTTAITHPRVLQASDELVERLLLKIRRTFLTIADGSTLPRLLSCALALRIGVWVVMAAAASAYAHSADGAVTYPARNPSDDSCFAYTNMWCHCRRASCPPGAADECATRSAASPMLQSWYRFFLRPFTRWDAARFLRLALYPQLRNPPLDPPDPHSFNEAFAESEQAHAFFPLYPRVIQATSSVLLDWVSPSFLPSTCEELMVLSAWIVSNVSFFWSLFMMYRLTQQLLRDDATARRATLLYAINPATVFFATSYSESLYAALILSGCVCLHRRDPLVPPLALWTLTVACWWLAAWTRANGILYTVGFALLWGTGQSFYRRSPFYFVQLLLVMWLMYRTTTHAHNRMGFERLCLVTSIESNRPEWCEVAIASSSGFDLYSYVQRRHWNVGLFRYYELKQLPNFLLAAPVLVVAASGVASWLRHSWHRFDRNGNQKVAPASLVTWAAATLHDTARPARRNAPETPRDRYYSAALMPHYATLCATAAIGLVIAHVQVTTRLLCSSCPALYWHMAGIVNLEASPRRGGLVVSWCILYTILGVVLHSMWLPWT